MYINIYDEVTNKYFFRQVRESTPNKWRVIYNRAKNIFPVEVTFQKNNQETVTIVIYFILEPGVVAYTCNSATLELRGFSTSWRGNNNLLTHFMLLISSDISWKQKTRGFLFLEGIEIDQWH